MRTAFSVLLVFLGSATAGDWTTVQVAQISQLLKSWRDIQCTSIMHPGDYATHDTMRLAKLLHKQDAFQMIRSLPIKFPGKIEDWKQCSHVLHILLGWLPNAKTEFQSAISNTQMLEATWLTFLPISMSPEEFVGNVDIPFTVRVLAAKPSEDNVHIEEVWRSAPGFTLRREIYAIWIPGSGLMCRRKACNYLYRKDLEGAELRAATKEDMPLSELAIKNGELAINGFFGDIFYELASQLNMTPVVVPARENVTGYATDGQWNGLIGMLQRDEIDLAVGPLSVHRFSLEYIDFVRPLLRTNYQVFFKQAGNVIEWDSILKPFARYVWLLILLWIIIAAYCLNVFYRIGVYRGQESREHLDEYSKLNTFLAFLRAFSNQGTDRMPTTMSCRALYLTGYLTSSILLTAYSAALISSLTTQEPLRPFDSLETFLQDGSYKLTAIGASTDYTYFSEATHETLKGIYQKQMLRSNLPTGKEEGLHNVCDGEKTALFITYAVTQISAREISISRNCRILHFKTPLGVVFLTLGIKKKMPYAFLITQQVQLMAEQGILNRLQNREWPLKSSGSNVNRASQQVEIEQVAQIYALLLAGMIFSLIIFAFEKLTFHRSNYKAYKVSYREHSDLLKESNVNILTSIAFFCAAIALLAIVISGQLKV